MNDEHDSAAQGGYPTSAEEWLAHLLSPDSDEKDAETFERWRAADPEHANAYAKAERIHRHAALLEDDPLLRAAARAALRDTAVRRQRRPYWNLAIGVAACLVLALSITWQFLGEDAGGQRYASGATLPRTVRLADGTQLRLDAQTELTVRLLPDRRELVLERGRIQLDVVHDASRPFVVQAGGNLIRDVGTVFQVSRDARGVDVALLRGAVDIRGRTGWTGALRPEQQVHLDGKGQPGPVRPLDVRLAEAWTQGELMFHERPLGELLADMNRYSTTQLALGDARLAGIKVSGSFHAGDQQALATALSHGWSLRVMRTGPHELLLLPTDRTQLR